MKRTTDEQRGYSKGYAAGKKRADKDLMIVREQNRELRVKLALLESKQKERVYMQCLELVVRDSNSWSIGGKKVDNAESYCTLADIFAKNAIAKING